MLQTHLIEHIEKSASQRFKKEQIIVDCKLASLIRRSMRDIFHVFYESEAELDKAAYIRMELLKFHSSPHLIHQDLINYLGFRDHQSFSRVWGSDLANTVSILNDALSLMTDRGSALVEALTNAVATELERVSKKELKIWCHRAELETYIELFKSNEIFIDEQNFISSLPEYRGVTPFETLILIGPLRHYGWSKKTRAIVSAPRYNKLQQIMWSGSQDGAEFTNDPLVSEKDYSELFSESKTYIYSSFEDDFPSPLDTDDIDDYQFFTEKPLPNRYSTKAVLLEFTGKKGVLLPIGSQQLVFDPRNEHPEFTYKTSSEIEPGSFLLMHDVSPQNDLDDFERVLAPLADMWKSALEEMYRTRYQQLMYLMEKSAIDLIDFDRAVKKWIQRDGTVVYGPQHKRHFRSLIEDVIPNCLGEHNWQEAWREIQLSRVKAIQHGRIEHAYTNELLVEELSSGISLISELCAGGNYFSHKLPKDGDLHGEVKFYPVNQKDVGFRVMPEILGNISAIEDFEQFRVEI